MKARAAVWSSGLVLLFAAGAALGAAQNPPQAKPQLTQPPVTLQPLPQRPVVGRNLADITNTTGGIIIGGAVGGAGGVFVPWGTSADLSGLTPLAVAGTVAPTGKCAFNITYHEKNIGSAPTNPLYTNTLKVIGPTNVAINSGRHLNAGEDKEVDTQAYLPEGSNALMLDLNDGHIAAESNYGNNFFSIKYTLQCRKPGNPNNPNATPTPTPNPKGNPNATPTPTPNPNGNPTGGPNGKLADVTSAKAGIIIGGAVGGAGGKFVPWGGVADLDDVDPLPGTANADQCAFNATYVETNIGGAPTSPLFTNKLKRDGSADVAINTGQHLNIGEVRPVTTQPYLMIGGHGLELSLNDGHIAAESNYGNNVFSIRYILKKCKRPAPVAKCDGLPDLISVLTNPMTGAVIEKNIGRCPAGPNKLTLTCQKQGFAGPGGGCAELPPGVSLGELSDPAFPNALTVNVPALAPGATFSFTVPFWTALKWNPGKYLFVAKADAANVVAESNEANNVSNSTLTVP